MSEQIKKSLSELNISTHTQTGDVYMGGTKPKNILHKDETGYFTISGYGKFCGKRYPIKNRIENKAHVEALNYFFTH